MGRSIEDKIVNISIDFKKFENGVKKVTQNADKLNKSLKFPDAGKGLENVSKAADKIDLSRVATGIEGVSGKLNALRLIAINAFADIASSAIRAGARFAKSFTLQPIIAGFQEYSTNLNAVQTILANTQASGATLKDVNAALLELNKYSDKTIYNFSQMAKNIGTFTAAGVDLDTATGAIKGIANLAALSGSNADQAATAMYQLSQAISSGRVSLMDWNSVVNAGMGGTVFQRALAQTAVSMGKLKDSSLKLVGPMKNVSINGQSFRQSIGGPGPKWLTSDVLTKTLQQFTGDLSDAQLKAEGFNDAQIKSIQQTAKTAQAAATQVKTLTQVFDVAKETAGSGWAQTFQLIFGNFGEAKTTFTALSNAINGFINTNAKARNKVLGDWKALGGRSILIKGIKEVFQALGDVLGTVKKSFRDIFPKRTGADLLVLTKRFKDFADAMQPSPKTLDNIRHTFHGLFALLDIGRQIVGGIFTVFHQLFQSVGVGQGGFLSFTASIGDFIVKIDEAMKKGNGFHDFFVKIGAVLAAPVKAILKMKDAIAGMFSGFSGFSSGGISSSVSGLTQALSPLQKVLEFISKAWQKFLGVFGKSSDFLQPTIDQFISTFQQLGPAIMDAVKNMNVEAILQVVRTGLLAGFFVLFRNFFHNTGALFRLQSRVTIFSLMFKNVGYGIDALTGSLKAMQTNIQSKTLKNIAISIALLVASVVALSLADPKRVNSAIATIGILLFGLLKTLKVLGDTTATVNPAKMLAMSVALNGIAVALNLMVIPVVILSRLDLGQLARGLGGVIVLLTTLQAAAQSFAASAGKLVLAGAGITALAVGLNVMVVAIKLLGDMDLQQLAKGLGAVAISLYVIAKSAQITPTGMIAQGAGLIALAVGLNVLQRAVAKFGNMDLRTLATGIGAMGLSLLVIGKAMTGMSKQILFTGPALITVALALNLLIKPIQALGAMSLKDLAKGIFGMGIALTVLSDAIYSMKKSIRGALALQLAATGIALLVPSLILLGKQDVKTIASGLIALGGAFAVIRVAGAGLETISAGLIAFGAAVLLVGGGIALAGVGIAALGVGLASIAVAGPTAIAIMIKALTDLTKAVGEMGKNIVLGVLEIVKTFAATSSQFVTAMVQIGETLIETVIRLTPKLGEAFLVLVHEALKVIRKGSPDVIATGLKLLLDLLKGIRDNISQVVVVAADIVVNLLKGIAQQATRIIGAGFDIIIAIVTGILKGLTRLVDAGARAIVRFLNAIADAITKYEPQVILAGARIGAALVTGMIKGMFSLLGHLKDKVKEMGHAVIKAAKGVFKVFSPSLEFTEIGKNVSQGLANGISKSKKPQKAAEDMSHNVVKATKSSLGVTAAGSTVMQDIGQQAAEGFAKGVRGSSSDIKNAFRDLNDKLTQATSDARKTIAEEQKKLDELSKHPKKNADAIKEAQQIIDQNQKILAKAVAGHTLLTKTLRASKNELQSLVNQYTKVGNQLKDANQVLADAKKARDDAFGEFADKYGALPEIVTTDAEGKKIDSLKTYTDSLISQTNAVAKFSETLKKLRKLGLDDQTYQKLLEDGTADQQFADQLLKGGASAVRGLNYLDGQLTIAAGTLADTASKSLYDVGVNISQGIVDGLKSKEKDLKDAAHVIADTIVSTVKKELKVKSPSEVFIEIGEYVNAGLAKGLIQSSKAVTDAAYMVSDNAMGAMRKGLSKASDLVANEINPNPTITPVLDLSQVQNGAKNLDSILASSPLSVDPSLRQASIISAGSLLQPVDSAPVSTSTTEIKFEQNNNSPKALDEIEIYRQTRNLISQLRSR